MGKKRLWYTLTSINKSLYYYEIIQNINIIVKKKIIKLKKKINPFVYNINKDKYKKI